jgi:hypothetical protein
MDIKPPIANGDDSFSEDQAFAAVSTLDEQPAEEVILPEWTGPRCDKCSAPIKTEMVKVCRSCGWYARLGTFVEVDPDWETEDELNQAPPPPQPSHLEVWMQLLPWWAWAIIATVSIVVVESVAVRLLAPSNSWFRAAWSFTQLIIGGLTFVGCHVFSFLIQATDDADMTIQDLLIRPLKVWKRVLQGLPVRLWLVNAAAAGLTAIVMSLAVIGGLDYERLLDWGFEQPKKQNLMGAMVSQMQKAAKAKDENLEDAVKDFAGSQNVDQQEQQQQPTPPPKPRLETDCVILGYRANQDGQIHTLLLGTSLGKKLVYAGTVAPPNGQEFAGLALQLAAAKSASPFLQVHTDATWVQPKFTCRVTYNTQKKDGRLLGLRWEEYSGTVSMP